MKSAAREMATQVECVTDGLTRRTEKKRGSMKVKRVRERTYTAGLFLHCIVLLLLLVVAIDAQEYDCDKGCSLDPALMGGPVCGADDLEYQNKCLAICQVRPFIVDRASCVLLIDPLSSHATPFFTIIGSRGCETGKL
jgi:hypothetical protein